MEIFNSTGFPGTRGSASCRELLDARSDELYIRDDNHKMAPIQIINLLVIRVNLPQSHRQPERPAKLAVAPVPRSAEQRRQPLPRLIVLRKPERQRQSAPRRAS